MQNIALLENLRDNSDLYLESEWTLRLRSLQYIQENLTNGETTYSDFTEEFKNFVPNLIIQLKDIRSAIVKESVKLLLIASQKFKSTFEPTAFKFIDVLFQLVNSTTNLISKSGYDGLKAIIENVYSWKIVMKVAENCKNKNTAARLIGSECLEFILKEYPKYLLDQGEQSTGVLLETLTATIKSVLQDQNPKIREIGKMIYVSFFEKYPEKANLILNSLQNPIKKQLEEIQKHKTLDWQVDTALDFPIDPKILLEDISDYEDMDIYTAVRAAISGGFTKQQIEVNIELILKKTQQANWSARESAFGSLASVLSSSTKDEDFDKSIPTVLSHLQDKHIKVVYGSLDCLSMLIQHKKSKLACHLPQIIKDVLEWSVHKKESVSAKANTILAQLLEAFSADELLNHFISLNIPRPNVKLAMMEIMNYLIESSETFCFNQYSCQNLVKKLSQLTQEASQPLTLSIIKCLEATCDKNVFLTLQGIFELPFDEQQIFKKLCQEHSVMLEEMLRGYTKNRFVPNIDVIEEVEEEDMTESLKDIDFNELLEECKARGPREYIGNLQYLIGKGELPYDSVKEVVEVLISGIDKNYADEFRKTLRGFGMIAKTYNIDKVGGDIISGLTQVYSWDNPDLIRDTDTVLQIIIEKMGTCNIVRSLLENIETSLEKSLEKLLAFLIEIVRERTDIKFYGKEISVHLRTLFVHPNPEIRKNVVLILAELKEMMGKDFDNLWELFSIQQKKLIEIYHHKITEE